MGEIVVEIDLENSGDRRLFEAGYREQSEIRRLQIPAVADTGAVMLALPQDVVRQLGLDEVGSVTTAFADGRRSSLPVAGPLTVRIGDREMPTNCVVVPTGADALIGQAIMEVLDLIADCASRTLAPRPESPDRPLIKL